MFGSQQRLGPDLAESFMGARQSSGRACLLPAHRGDQSSETQDQESTAEVQQ